LRKIFKSFRNEPQINPIVTKKDTTTIVHNGVFYYQKDKNGNMGSYSIVSAYRIDKSTGDTLDSKTEIFFMK